MNRRLAARIERLVAFLPMFETDAPGTWAGGERQPDGSITMPTFAYTEAVSTFIQTCYDDKWVDPTFDWGAWTDEGQAYERDPDRVATADLTTLRQLITAHIRADRFVEGHLAEVIASGHIAALLRRLAVLGHADSETD